MYFIYIDDSTDRPRHVFSALAVPTNHWNEVFACVKEWREHLRDDDGISTRHELHARKFVSGRGTGGQLTNLSRHRRCQIFNSSFHLCANLGPFGVRSFNVSLNNDRQDWAFERLLNRINRTLKEWDAFGHLICDQGKEDHYTKMVRRMRVHNLIPSNRGVWRDTGKQHRNIPLERIIEDPQFKSSARSYFIQLVDFSAFGLLRMDNPTPRVKKHGIHKSLGQYRADGKVVWQGTKYHNGAREKHF